MGSFLGCLLVVSSLSAEDKIPAEQVLPRNTMAMISVPSIQEFKVRYDDTVWEDLFSNPDMAPFWSSLSEPVMTNLDELGTEYGVDWKELAEIPTGEVTVSITRVKRGVIGVTLSLEYGEAVDAVEKLLTSVEENLEKAEKTRQTIEFEETEVISYSLSPPGAKPQEQHSLAWFQKDGFLVISSQLGALEAILLRWDGENTDVLSEKDDFKYIRERCRVEDSEPVMYWYIDPLFVVRTGLETQGATQQALFQTFLPRFGLDKLKSMGGSVDLATERFESVSQVVVYADSPQAGVMKLFQAEATAISPPDWVSANIQSFMVYHWKLEEALSAARTLVDTFQPGSFDRMMDGLAEHPGAQGLHPQKDFLDLLKGTIAVEVTVPPSGDAADGTITLMAAELKDRQRMEDVLAKVQKMDNAAIKVRNFQGSTIYQFPLANEASLELTISQDTLFVTDHATRIEKLLRGGESMQRLKDSPQFLKLAAEAPEAAGMWGIDQTHLQVERMSQEISDLLNQLPQNENSEEARKVFQSFPEADVLKKYFPDTFFYVTEDERGVYWKSYSLRKN
jgi:hypothetical protein